jgi:hypothetical protein
MPQFGFLPTITADCRELRIPDVYSGGAFNLSSETALSASMTVSRHNSSTSTTYDVLDPVAAALLTGISVEGNDIVISETAPCTLDAGIWGISFEYTYNPGSGIVSELVCKYVAVDCALKGNIVNATIAEIPDADCVDCGQDLSLETNLWKYHRAMEIAVDCDQGNTAGNLYDFIKDAINVNNECKNC